MSAAADEKPILRYDPIDFLNGAAGIDRSRLRRRFGLGNRRLDPIGDTLCPIAEFGQRHLCQNIVDRRDAQLRVAAQMSVRDHPIVPHGAWIGIDLDDPGLRVKLSEMGREAAQARANRDHEIRFGEQLRGEIRGPTATDPDRERIIAKKAPRRQRCRQQRPASLRQFQHVGFSAGLHHASARQDDGSLGRRDQVGDRARLLGVGSGSRIMRQESGRRNVFRHLGEARSLQVVGDTEDDRPTLVLSDTERLAHPIQSVVDALNLDVLHAACANQRSLIDLLNGPGSSRWRLSGKHAPAESLRAPQ